MPHTFSEAFARAGELIVFLNQCFYFWAGLSLAINVLLKIKPAEKWVALARLTRLGGWVIGILETWGIDPVPGIKLTAAFVAGRAAMLSGHELVSRDHDLVTHLPPASGPGLDKHTDLAPLSSPDHPKDPP
jgi:hypothetical protein